jgi:nitroreductase
MEVRDAILGRRSVRNFTVEDVGDASVAEILEAGRWAPSGLNNQPWRFRILRGQAKDAIAKHTKYGAVILRAPVCVAVFYDGGSGYNRTKDMQAVGACVQNMLLRAYDLGLGAVWLGEIINQHERVEKELCVGYELMAVVAVGHPAEGGGDPDRESLRDLMV